MSSSLHHPCLSADDAVVAYNILVAGRLVIACYVGAKHAGEAQLQAESQRVIQAASLLLHMMVISLPIALGAAEVLDETSRGELRELPAVTMLTISLWRGYHQARLVHDGVSTGEEECMVQDSIKAHA